MAKKGDTTNKNLSMGIFNAIITSVAVTAVVFIIYAVLITYTNITEESVQTVVIVTTLISVLTGGIMAAKNAENKGWLYGMGVGVCYAVIMIVTGITLSPDSEIGIKTASTLLLAAAGGGVGGMIGINLGNMRK